MREFCAETKVGGVLTIKKFREGKLVWQSAPMRNHVVSGSGYGRNILARQLAGDTTYPIELDSASVGDDDTSPVDGDTDLGNPLVTDIPLTDIEALNDEVHIDIFIADGNLADDTYKEVGFFASGRLFSRVIITPSYTKASGEDTLFTYHLTLSG